jgi:hypothetical protein
MTFYTCTTCKHVNGVWRLHCQICSTIPTQYSMTGKAELSIVPAYGVERQGSRPIQRLHLATVELDYYAGA